jgi:hypothetical protein
LQPGRRYSAGKQARRGGRATERYEIIFSGGVTMVQTLVVVLMGLAPLQSAVLGDDLAAPVRLEAAGKPIDTEVGHAAPFVCDFDGDGVQDLLVGQFGDGLLWIYHNEGTNVEPKLAEGVKFKDGMKDGRVPCG